MLALNLIIINLFVVHHCMRSGGTDAGDFYISAPSGPGTEGRSWRDKYLVLHRPALQSVAVLLFHLISTFLGHFSLIH